MKKILVLLLSLSFSVALCAQVPQGITYQAIARDGSGKAIADQVLPVRIAIQTSLTGGTLIWEEDYSATTNTSGLLSLVIGQGTRRGGSALKFSDIDWNKQPLFLKTSIMYPLNTWTEMGTSQIWAVPYSLVSRDLEGPLEKLSVSGTATAMDEALFEVKNNTGQTVFAVYNEGVRVYVEDGETKSAKGGFAVGGFGAEKGSSQNYLVVKPDTVRIYIDDTQGKASKGGFAVGGFGQEKAEGDNYFNISTDASGIINPPENRILWYPLKNAFLAGNILIEHPDSVGINSFSTGYQSRAKGSYSQAMGYSAKARGDFSTSIGKSSIAKGNSSFAFGNQARASANDSYALGTGAVASGSKSFALGSVGTDSSGVATSPTIASGESAFSLGLGSVASGQGSFTFGLGNTASGPFSMAIGYKTTCDGWYSTSIGWGTKSSGVFSTAMGAGTVVEPAGWCATATGILTKAGNWASFATGDRSYASGHTSFATGFSTMASGQLSSTFGDRSTASGYASMAIGYNSTAQSYASLVLGRYNTLTGSGTTWYSYDPALVIGNGTSTSARSNALTVYKNGNADFAGRINANSYLNINRGTASGVAMWVNDDEAIWYDGTYYSWGYGGTYNFFGDAVTIGTSTVPGYTLVVNGTAAKTGGGSWSTLSDERLKDIKGEFTRGLNEIIALDPVVFNYKDGNSLDLPSDQAQIGFIAQEVKKIFPEAVGERNDGYLDFNMHPVNVALVNAVKELNQKLENINKENEELKAQIGILMDRINKIELLSAGLTAK